MSQVYYLNCQCGADTELGKFKDELGGLLIEEALFLGIKQYGYKYVDRDGQQICKSTFAGVPRNSLTFKDIEYLFEGGEIQLKPTIRFFKSFISLTITIKPVGITIKKNNFKELQGNNYLTVEVNLNDNSLLRTC